MTLDQFLHLLAVLVWPFVAIVGAIVVIRCTWLLVKTADEIANQWRRTWLERSLLVEERRASTALTVARTQARMDVKSADMPARVTASCESALLAVLQANGGFPGSRDDHVTRQMVREIREMYAELESPTKAPPAPPKSSVATFVDEFYDDEGTDRFGHARPAHMIVDDADELDELDEEL